MNFGPQMDKNSSAFRFHLSGGHHSGPYILVITIVITTKWKISCSVPFTTRNT